MNILLSDLYWQKRAGMALFNTSSNLEEYISRLQDSIKKEGIKVPPRIELIKEKDKSRYNHKKYLVLQGNHRVEAASRLGFKSVQCNVIDR